MDNKIKFIYEGITLYLTKKQFDKIIDFIHILEKEKSINTNIRDNSKNYFAIKREIKRFININKLWRI